MIHYSSYAIAHGLPVNLVRTICTVESSNDPSAFRYEPGYRWLIGDKLTMNVTEKFGQMCSWGIMQVMGAVARERGYTGHFPGLCNVETGLEYGCRHLAHLYKRYSNWPDAIAAYNAGSPRKGPDGQYFNQGYVNKVDKCWMDYDAAPLPV
jgi:hypothetical protein